MGKRAQSFFVHPRHRAFPQAQNQASQGRGLCGGGGVLCLSPISDLTPSPCSPPIRGSQSRDSVDSVRHRG